MPRRSMPRRFHVSLSIALSLAILTASAAVAEQEPRASLPLEEVLRLYRENEASKTAIEALPPFAATVSKAELDGRLLDDGVDLGATFEVVVLSDKQWTSVPLLVRGPSTQITDLPVVENAILAVAGDRLVLVSHHTGTYRFEVGLHQRAQIEGRRRIAQVEIAEVSLASLLLRVDEGLFALDSPIAGQRGDGVLIRPENGRFNVAWRRIAELRENVESVPRPPIESVISAAHASVVTTLEGKAIVRLRYELRFEGTRPIVFAIPEGYTAERVYLNGVAQQVKVADEGVVVDAAPGRAGDRTGVVELVLEADRGGFNLSGDLFFELPRASWPTNELYVRLDLPEVFNYTWTGGSLSRLSEEAPDVDFTYQIPTPGKRLELHQFLISKSSPTLRVSYAIDLTGSYFGADDLRTGQELRALQGIVVSADD